MNRDMSAAPPPFSYYGSKHRLAKKYPGPMYDTIIEPFAGSAAYARHYWWKDVILFEKYDVLAGVWDFLIKSNDKDIMSIPLLREDQTVDDLSVCQEAKWLLGFLVNSSVAKPAKRLSKWARSVGNVTRFWSEKCRFRLASNVHKFSHWKIANCGYQYALDMKATWFIDPPYQSAGKFYAHGSSDINYSELAMFCRSRSGQVIVCENDGADWLPFEHFATTQGSATKGYSTKPSKEVVWIKNE